MPGQQDNYRRSGFELAYRNIRYGGTPAGRGRRPSRRRTVPFEQLLTLDARLFPAPRPGFLAGWISLPESQALAALDDGELRGFGVRRGAGATDRALRIDALIAEQLFDGLCEGIAREPIFLDVPVAQRGRCAGRRARSRAGVRDRPDVHGPGPAIELAQPYGVTTFELG